MTTWVVVAHRAGARFLEVMGPGKGLTLVKEEDHPEGRLTAGEVDTDRPGTVIDHGGGGPRAMDKKEHADERVAHDFARHIAKELQHARNENQITGFVLVAEPGFLGMLRSSLDGPTAKILRGTVGKDLAHVELRDIGSHLEGVVPV